MKDNTSTDNSALYVSHAGAGDKPALVFDVERFDKILNRPDIPEAERHAALQELWHLIGMFIDVGWGVYSLDDVHAKRREQSRMQKHISTIPAENMVDLDMQSLMEEFIQSAKLDNDTKGDAE